MSQITNFVQFRDRYQYDPKKDKLGEGGFGMVYKARDKARTRLVAIKRAIVKTGQVYTLQREVALASKLPVHANIAFYENEVYRFENDAGEEHDYAIMQYYPQGNLSQYVKIGTLNIATRKILIAGILSGVQHLHTQGLIHRDLKPSNILIALDDDNQPVPKITDFGISKVAAAGKSLSNSGTTFTLAYMSPEQGRLERIDHRSDLWSVGAVIYFICTGRHAFASDDDDDDTEAQQADIRYKVLNAILPNDLFLLPAPYNEMIRRCFIADRNERAQSAKELLLLLAPAAATANKNINSAIVSPKIELRVPKLMKTVQMEPEIQKKSPSSSTPTNKKILYWIAAALISIVVLILGIRSCGDSNSSNFQANTTDTTANTNINNTPTTEPNPITTTTLTPSTTTSVLNVDSSTTSKATGTIKLSNDTIKSVLAEKLNQPKNLIEYKMVEEIGDLYNVGISKNAKYIAGYFTTNYGTGKEQYTIKIWRLAPFQLLYSIKIKYPLLHSSGSILSFDYTESKLLYQDGEDLFSLNLNTLNSQKILTGIPLFAGAFNPINNDIIYLCAKDEAFSYSLSNKNKISSVLFNDTETVFDAGRTHISLTDNNIYFNRIFSKQLIRFSFTNYIGDYINISLGDRDDFYPFAISPNEKYIAKRISFHLIGIFDFDELKKGNANPLGTYEHANSVTDLKFTNSLQLLSCSVDRTVGVFTVPNCKIVARFIKKGKLSYAGPLQISSNNKFVVGSLYGRMFVLDY